MRKSVSTPVAQAPAESSVAARAEALAELPQLLVLTAHISRTAAGPGWKTRCVARFLGALREAARRIFDEADLAAAARDGYARIRQCDDTECSHLTCAALGALTLFVECGALESDSVGESLFAHLGGPFMMAVVKVFGILAHAGALPDSALLKRLALLPSCDTAEDFAVRVACMRTIVAEPYGAFYKSCRFDHDMAFAACQPMVHDLDADFTAIRHRLGQSCGQGCGQARGDGACGCGVSNVDDWCDAAAQLGVDADTIRRYNRQAHVWCCAV